MLPSEGVLRPVTLWFTMPPFEVMMPPSGNMLSPSAAFIPPFEGVIPPSVVYTSLRRIMSPSVNMVHLQESSYLPLEGVVPPSDCVIPPSEVTCHPLKCSVACQYIPLFMVPHVEGMMPPSKTCCRPPKLSCEPRPGCSGDNAACMQKANSGLTSQRKTQRSRLRLNIFLPVVDAVTSKLTRRFPDNYPGKDLMVIPSRLGGVRTVLLLPRHMKPTSRPRRVWGRSCCCCCCSPRPRHGA